MKKSRRKLQSCTNQIGKGDGAPNFELVRPPDDNFFQLEVIQSRSFKQSHAAREITYRAKLKNPSDDVPLNNLLTHLHALFETILQETKREYGDAGVMRIYISHPKLEKSIIIPPTYLGYLNSQKNLDYIDTVLYSAGEIPADDELIVNAAVVEFVTGSGRKAIIDIDNDLLCKRAIVKIRNTDYSCLPRAIVVGYKHLMTKLSKDQESLKVYNRIRDYRCSLQRIEATNLRQGVGIPDNRFGTIEDIYLYEDFLQVGIVVISARAGNRKVYPGSPKYENKIFLYHSGLPGKGHFDTIVKVNALLCKQYYCDKCDKGFKSRTSHKCDVWCNVCGRENCQKKNDSRSCPDCNKEVRSESCYIAHKLEKKRKGTHIMLPSLCEQNWQCKECGISLKRNEKENHECGEITCHNCGHNYMSNDKHLCYMRSFTSDLDPDKFIFYDFECTQVDGKHRPNFVVAHSICNECENNPVTAEATCKNCGSRCIICDKFNEQEKEFERYPCEGCGKRQVIFKGSNTQQDFCKWLISKQHKDFTVIAHNARGYDSYFIYDYLIENSHTPHPVIFSGSKIMCMSVPTGGLNIRFLDSLNFLPMPLAQLPKSFGLEELKKGFFPHFFNTPDNQEVVLLNLPDIKYYDPDSMSKDRRNEFLDWYKIHKSDQFDFQKEMQEYCISDVDILLQACWKFRQLLKSQTGEECQIENLENMITKTIRKNAVDSFSFLTIASVTKQGGLFTQYINTFLKLKQESSGYPQNVKSEEQKQAYIDQYLDHEGILLDKECIDKNPGLRSLSKLALNSFYGKFGQRTNMKKTLFVKDIKQLMQVLTDPGKLLMDFHIMNDDVIQVEYKNTEDFECQSFNTNVTIAAFCTSWARLKLWSVMQKLGKRVLYHDTDCIIFSVKDGEYVPPLGTYLGQLTDELTCKELGCKKPGCSGHWIEEFVSCGPKNYSFRVNTGEIVCKVRGFSLNYKSSLILNFESMKEALVAWKRNEKKELITVKTELVRDKYKPKVFNRVISKHYGVVYDKRKVLPDFTSIPFGFRY